MREGMYRGRQKVSDAAAVLTMAAISRRWPVRAVGDEHDSSNQDRQQGSGISSESETGPNWAAIRWHSEGNYWLLFYNCCCSLDHDVSMYKVQECTYIQERHRKMGPS
jgi:hypothetical protein